MINSIAVHARAVALLLQIEAGDGQTGKKDPSAAQEREALSLPSFYLVFLILVMYKVVQANLGRDNSGRFLCRSPPFYQ